MIHTIKWFIYFWIQLLLSYPRLKKINKNSKLKENTYLIAQEWAGKLLNQAKVSVNVTGLDNITKDTPILFVANHQSNFDIPVLLKHLNTPIGFIAKKEIKKIPIVNQWMNHLNCIFIDRGNPRAAVRSINQGAKSISSGNPIVIFPEGTRSSTGKLNDFKPGSLKLATKSKATIIPVAIDGTINIMKKGEKIISPGSVDLKVLKPLNIPDEFHRDTRYIANLAKNKIQESLNS